MLKACCDCIAQNIPREPHDAYGSADASTRANGHVLSAPPWPRPSRQNERMFLLPKPLAAGDKVLVTGSMTDNPRTIALSLVTGYSGPDYANIACQIEMRLPASGEDSATVRIVKDGAEVQRDELTESIPSADLFPDSSFTFEFLLTMREYSGAEHHQIDIHVGGNFIHDIILQHNASDIRFLTLQGDVAKVDKLEFAFEN